MHRNDNAKTGKQKWIQCLNILAVLRNCGAEEVKEQKKSRSKGKNLISFFFLSTNEMKNSDFERAILFKFLTYISTVCLFFYSFR